MSKTLVLVDRLLALGRIFQQMGRDHDALRVLGKLAGFRELPQDVSEETQARLVELHLLDGRFVRARRLLTALLVQRPDSARYHYQMATALDGDTKSDTKRAADHYERSLACDADQPECLGKFGLLALRLGRTAEGLASLRKSVELAPNDPDVVGRLVEGLRQEGMTEEALSVLRAARFRNARDPRFHKLQNDFLFALLRQEQLSGRVEGNSLEELSTEPRLLAFVRPDPDHCVEAAGKIVRRDPAESPRPPHRPGRTPTPNKKNVQ